MGGSSLPGIGHELDASGSSLNWVVAGFLLVDIARIVSGAGGAGIMAAGGALLASNYDGTARNRAFAFMGTMAGVGIAIGHRPSVPARR